MSPLVLLAASFTGFVLPKTGSSHQSVLCQRRRKVVSVHDDEVVALVSRYGFGFVRGRRREVDADADRQDRSQGSRGSQTINVDTRSTKVQTPVSDRRDGRS